MINLFYADLYRLIRQKSTWIILIVSVLIFLFTGGSMGILTGNAPWVLSMQEKFRQTIDLYRSEGLNTEVFEETLSLIDAMKFGSRFEFAGQLITYDMMLFITAFLGFFTVPEKTGGYGLFLMPSADCKSMFFKRALILLLYSTFLTVSAAAALLCESFIFYRNVNLGVPFPFILFLILKILLVFVYGLFIMMLSDRFRKGMRAVILSVIYILFGSGILYNLINSIFSNTGFRIEYCTPIGAMGLITVGDYKTYLAALLVIITFFVISVLEEKFVISKQDLT